VKPVIRVFDRFEEAEEADLADWLALSPEERLRIGESMRREVFPDGEAPMVRCLTVRDPGADDE
jgi:hypothetical protein